MKRFTIMGALAAMLAFSVMAVAAGTASAAIEWLCNGKAVLKAKECPVVTENLEVLLFQDRNASAEIECAVSETLGTGWVGPGAEDEISSGLIIGGCKGAPKALNLKEEEVANSCTSAVAKVVALNLPWRTLLEEIGGLDYDTIEPGTEKGAQPGYESKCETILGTVTDTCLSTEGHEVLTEMNNLALEGAEFPLVDSLFLAKPIGGEKEWGTCSVGGKESAVVVGENLIAALTENEKEFQSLEIS